MSNKPNIIVIMTDQQRADVSAREGFPLDTTPFLDSLAMRGMWFNSAYTTCPYCAPARVSMLTGRYPSVHGERSNVNCRDVRYGRDLIDVLQEQGYQTAMIGKNHSHLVPERLDYWSEYHHNGGLGEHRNHDEKAFDNWLCDLTLRIGLEPTPFPLEAQSPCRIVREAISWIDTLTESAGRIDEADKGGVDKDAGGNPFFLWMSFPEPHNPYQVPEPYFSMFPPELLPPVIAGKEALKHKGYKWTFTKNFADYAHPDHDTAIARARSNYFGMLRLIDDQVRKFVEHLEKRGLMDNTVLVFLSDHGDFTGEYGLLRKGPELPELLMRVPMFFVGPGLSAGAEPQSAFVSIADIMPTLCEIAGSDIPYGVQGRSLLPMLTGKPYPKSEFDSIYAEHGYGGLHYGLSDQIPFDPFLIRYPNGPTYNEVNAVTLSGVMRMVRMDRWKLVFDMMGHGELYDLETDPRELDNLYDSVMHAEIRCSLLERMLTWTLRVQDPLPLPRNKYEQKRREHNYYSTC